MNNCNECLYNHDGICQNDECSFDLEDNCYGFESKSTYDRGYKQGRADALSIDMGKPMHFTDEQKAWVKKYIIINAELQRERAIEETICFIKHEEAEGNIHSLDDYDRIAELVKEQTNG